MDAAKLEKMKAACNEPAIVLTRLDKHGQTTVATKVDPADVLELISEVERLHDENGWLKKGHEAREKQVNLLHRQLEDNQHE